jgi:hypothetical protein
MFRLSIILLLPYCFFGCEQPERKIVPPKPVEQTSEQDQEPTESSTNSLLVRDEQSAQDRIDKFLHKPPEDDSHISFGVYRTIKPPSWFWTPPKSHIVNVNYIVPSVDEHEHAVFSVTQFGVGEGGHFTENVTRWKSLFRTNDGAPVKPAFNVLTVNGHEAVIAEFQGEYMGAGAAWHKRNHSLLVAEVRELDGNIYFKLLGPTPTVNAHRAGLLNVLHSLELLPASP